MSAQLVATQAIDYVANFTTHIHTNLLAAPKAPGPKDFFNGPDFSSLSGLSGVSKVIFGLLLAILAILSGVAIVRGFIRFATASGDLEKHNKGLRTTLEGVVGLAAAILFYYLVPWMITLFQNTGHTIK